MAKTQSSLVKLVKHYCSTFGLDYTESSEKDDSGASVVICGGRNDVGALSIYVQPAEYSNTGKEEIVIEHPFEGAMEHEVSASFVQAAIAERFPLHDTI